MGKNVFLKPYISDLKKRVCIKFLGLFLFTAVQVC